MFEKQVRQSSWLAPHWYKRPHQDESLRGYIRHEASVNYWEADISSTKNQLRHFQCVRFSLIIPQIFNRFLQNAYHHEYKNYTYPVQLLVYALVLTVKSSPIHYYMILAIRLHWWSVQGQLVTWPGVCDITIHNKGHACDVDHSKRQLQCQNTTHSS